MQKLQLKLVLNEIVLGLREQTNKRLSRSTKQDGGRDSGGVYHPAVMG